MSYEYSRDSLSSILEYAIKLKGKSLRDACNLGVVNNTYTGKGNFGQILEKYYFHYEPNSVSEPDFHEVGLELKTSPLKKGAKNHFSAKERLVLSIINYFEIVNQDFETSSFFTKNNHLLLIFYLHENGVDVLDLISMLVGDWKIPDEDLIIIKSDWDTIQGKIKSGKAHELSEGDTFYLGACTKGGKGGNPRAQPFSNIPAKQRAFALKQGYLNHIIGKLSKINGVSYGKIIESTVSNLNFEELVISKFEKFYNINSDEIGEQLGINLNKKAKSYYASLTKKILGLEVDEEIEEFEKADVIVKTVRLKENYLPKEDLSFPAFKYTEIINQEWDDSALKEILDHKFLFIFFQIKGDKIFLKRAKFWNMSASDKSKVELVWNMTKQIVEDGNIVKQLSDKGIRRTNFPSKKFSSIAHVRPHAKNANDTFPLPFLDKLTRLNSYTKHCFWLNGIYIKDVIFLK
jgi:DNA mismatch repair protein MutH